MIGNYITVKTLADKWKVSTRTVQTMCAKGKIKGAVKFGKSWAIPIDVNRPDDERVSSGKYINWRKTADK